MQKSFFSFLFLLGFTLTQSSVFAQTENKVANAFLKMLDGTEEAAQKAIDQYGSEDVIANKMIPFGKSPKVTKVEENCVYFTLAYDEESNNYFICIEGDKVIDFNWQE